MRPDSWCSQTPDLVLGGSVGFVLVLHLLGDDQKPVGRLQFRGGLLAKNLLSLALLVLVEAELHLAGLASGVSRDEKLD